MKQLAYCAMIALAVMAGGCTSEELGMPDGPFGNGGMMGGGGMPGGGGMGSAAVSANVGELTSFNVEIDRTPLSESESVDTSDEDYLEYEGNDFSSVITINFDTGSVSGTVAGVSVDNSTADIIVNSSVKGVRYVLTGSTDDGSLKIYSDKKFELVLDGVSICNPTGPAINIQSGKRGYIVLADGTANTLSDGTSYDAYANAVDGEDMKGTFFSEGKMLFSGKGSLEVYAGTKAGISCDDYIVFRPGVDIYVNATSGNGIKANDAIKIKGGVINVETSDAAAKGLSCDGYIVVDGGRTTAICSGGTEYDSDDKEYNGCAAMKSDSTFTINGGILRLKSTGDGGKGLKCGQDAIFNGGSVYALATGNSKNDVAPKAVRIAGPATVNGGLVMARSSKHEGFETKGTLTVNGGFLEAYANDDGINSASTMTLKGGFVFGYGEANDGIDSNGDLIISGATAIALGAGAPECGFDANEEKGYSMKLTDGTAIGLGGGTSVPSSSDIKYTRTSASLSEGTAIALVNDGKAAWAFKTPRSYNNAVLFVADKKMTSDSNLKTGVTVDGTEYALGFYNKCTVSE